MAGRGLEEDAKILSRIVEESTRPPRSRDEDVVTHLYFARGMVNWYLERPLIAAEMFREVANRRRKPNQAIPRFRAVVNQMLCLAQAGGKPDVGMLSGLPFDREGIHELYLSGLAYEALGKTEKAISTWFRLLEQKEATPRKTPAAKPTPTVHPLGQLLEDVRTKLRERINEEEAREDRYEDLVDYLNFASGKLDQALNQQEQSNEALGKVSNRQALESFAEEMVERAEAGEAMLGPEASSAMQYLIAPAYLQMNDPKAAIKAILTTEKPVAEGRALPEETVTAVRTNAAEALVSALVKQGRASVAKKVWNKYLAGGEAE